MPYGDERCEACNAPLPERAPDCRCAYRYCEQDWWWDQWTLYEAGRFDEVKPIALARFEGQKAWQDRLQRRAS